MWWGYIHTITHCSVISVQGWKDSSIPGGRSLTFEWNKGIPGRYINVVIPGSNRLLTLCEVEVYGYPAPDGENMNIYDQDLHSVALIKV